MRRIWIATVLVIAGCAQAPAPHEEADEPDFSIPADARGKAVIATRADIEALPADIGFVTSGDHGSVELYSEDLAALARLKHLQRLHLRHCRGIGDQGMTHLAKLKSLRELDLSGCTALTGAGIAKLAALKNLRELLLNFCPKIKKSEIEDLQRALPRADIVWSSDDPPMGAPPDHPERR
ncbi:hypothetical protein PLCT1_01378 [Planctomycetaceae bacterium]|nr:hypothetical protein PLCT1_01378 [Planctomycetaceae bacterium]